MPPPLVLVVDDNVDACSSLAALLELEGYEVVAAFDGISALALADERQPGVVVIDLSLPDISGEEVARRIRQAHARAVADATVPPPPMPVLIALSGRDPDDRVRSAGFDHALLKPATLERLLACFPAGSPA